MRQVGAVALTVALVVGCSGSHKAVERPTPTTSPAGRTILHVGPAPTVDTGGGCGTDTATTPSPGQAYSLCPQINQGDIPAPPTQGTVTTYPSLGGGPTLPDPGRQYDPSGQKIFNGPPATCPPYFGRQCPTTTAP